MQCKYFSEHIRNSPGGAGQDPESGTLANPPRPRLPSALSRRPLAPVSSRPHRHINLLPLPVLPSGSLHNYTPPKKYSLVATLPVAVSLHPTRPLVSPPNSDRSKKTIRWNG